MLHEFLEPSLVTDETYMKERVKEERRTMFFLLFHSQIFVFEDLVVKKQAMRGRILVVQYLMLPLREKSKVISWTSLNAIRIGLGETI